MRVLDLFSGIGGFSLAADWCGWETVAFCEQDKFCQRVLAKHWPGVTIYDDIKQLKGDSFEDGTIDLVCGGFPCQPWSTSGKRRGAKDDRHLWPEMLRVIKEIKPRWVVAENVAGIVKMALDNVLSDLESEGYTVQSFIIPACAVNAQHRRDRVWVVAHATGQRSQSNTEPDCRKSGSGAGIQPEFSRIYGNLLQQTTPNADSTGSQKQQFSTRYGGVVQSRVWHRLPDPQRERGAGQAEPRVCRIDDGLSAGMDTDIKDCFSVPAWVAKDETGPNYKNRIKLLGNAVVPQVVYQIFKAIQEIENAPPAISATRH